jgi:hypothetical protein
MCGCENYTPGELVRGKKGLKTPGDFDLQQRGIIRGCYAKSYLAFF